jgi:hypothetical protein
MTNSHSPSSADIAEHSAAVSKVIWMHKKRGTTYQVVTHFAMLQCASDQETEDRFQDLNWTIYRSREDDAFYVRLTSEFMDGRFERIGTATDAQPSVSCLSELDQIAFQLEEWIRQPDWAETFSHGDMRKWMDERPTNLVWKLRAIAAQPPAAPVDTDARIKQDYTHSRLSADSEIAKLREEVEKWHRVAMEAGAITCVGGSHIYPLRDEVKKLRADLLAYEITFKRIAEEDALHAAEPQGAREPRSGADELFAKLRESMDEED